MDFPLKEVVGSATTLAVGLLAFYQWRRTRRSGKFLQDREQAYKEVWSALEDANLLVRSAGYTPSAFDEQLRSTNALVMKHGLYLVERDQDAVRRYLAAMRECGRVLSTERAEETFAELKNAMYTTAPGISLEHLVPDYQQALRELDESRSAVVYRFREVIGAE